MGDTMKASFFSMTEAKYAAGESIKHTIFDNVETAQVLHHNFNRQVPQFVSLRFAVKGRPGSLVGYDTPRQ